MAETGCGAPTYSFFITRVGAETSRAKRILAGRVVDAISEVQAAVNAAEIAFLEVEATPQIMVAIPESTGVPGADIKEQY